jgi:Uma2 family endonuclease
LGIGDAGASSRGPALAIVLMVASSGRSPWIVRSQALQASEARRSLPAMVIPAPSDSAVPARVTVERFFALADEGLLEPDDRVELLGGVVVAMSPHNPPHDAVVTLVHQALLEAVGTRAAVRCQCSLVLGPFSAPEPDVAVVAGRARDYMTSHPRSALLVVEVADTSLVQDRLTKAALYAAAGLPEYWIVEIRADCVEVLRDPDAETGRYRERTIVARGGRLTLAALPDVTVSVDDFLPGALGGPTGS